MWQWSTVISNQVFDKQTGLIQYLLVSAITRMQLWLTCSAKMHHLLRAFDICCRIMGKVGESPFSPKLMLTILKHLWDKKQQFSREVHTYSSLHIPRSHGWKKPLTQHKSLLLCLKGIPHWCDVPKVLQLQDDIDLLSLHGPGQAKTDCPSRKLAAHYKYYQPMMACEGYIPTERKPDWLFSSEPGMGICLVVKKIWVTLFMQGRWEMFVARVNSGNPNLSCVLGKCSPANNKQVVDTGPASHWQPTAFLSNQLGTHCFNVYPIDWRVWWRHSHLPQVAF